MPALRPVRCPRVPTRPGGPADAARGRGCFSADDGDGNIPGRGGAQPARAHGQRGGGSHHPHQLSWEATGCQARFSCCSNKGAGGTGLSLWSAQCEH